MSFASVMPSNNLILWCPLLLLPSIFPSIRDFSNESVVHLRWTKCWNLSFNISLPKEYSGFITLKIDWFDLLPVQGTLMSLFQHHSSKASILWRSAFFAVQLSHLNVITQKTIALTIVTFVHGVMSLLFNTLSRFVIAFLPRSKRLLISWLQSSSAVILEPKERKSVTTSTFPPYLPWSNGAGCHDLRFCFVFVFVFLILSFKLSFSLSSFTLIKRLLSSSSLSAIRVWYHYDIMIPSWYHDT